MYLQHTVNSYPPSQKSANIQRPCRVCIKRYSKRRDTRYYCVQCNVPLCIIGCFNVILFILKQILLKQVPTYSNGFPPYILIV